MLEMSGKMPLGKKAVGLFGKMLEPYLSYFDTLKLNLKKVGVRTPVNEYVCALILYSLIGFIVALIVGSLVFAYFIPMLTNNISGYDAVYSYTLSIIIAILTGGGVFLAGYYLPPTKAKSLKSKIDRSLPFAVFYMATTASSGINHTEIFNMLSKRGGVIGDEAGRIYNDVNTLGMDLSDALQKAAVRTPSNLFADLLWSMATIVTTGGDMQKYLSGKTKSFMAQYRRNLNNYANQIALYTEIYVTLVIVGSLFFIVLLSILSPMVGGSGFSLVLQTFLVFFFIPAVSMGFIVLLKGIYPSE